MSHNEETIAYCHSCGSAMDVSDVAPFSNVECPSCHKHTRVKREFGPFTLLRRHAIGGMSMVFIGHDNTLDREVALKILSEDYSADEKRISSFEEEARITAAISHPHVVRVFKTGKAFGRFYIAMELVAGGHLEHQIRERGALPEAEALQLAIEVAEGLQSAHAVGLIHRDIKPGNILLDSAGSAKIVDFGLALMTKGGVAKPDELWATPYYVPPETIEGLEEDYRADVYAFGATFYHVLAGKPPCTETSMVTTQLREAKKHVIPISNVCPNLALETCAAIECAMAYDPNARFRSYDELINTLKTALIVVNARDKNLRKGIAPAPRAPAAVALTPADRRRIAKKRQQRNIIIAIASVAIVALLVALLVKQFTKKEITNNGQPIVTAHSVGTTSSGSSGLEIGALYQQARNDQKKNRYESAHSSFVQLRDDSRVQEPTRSWCGFEAMLSSLLNGNSEQARNDARELARHLASDSAPEQMRRRLTPWLEQMQKLPPVLSPFESIEPDRDTLYLMACTASACKNWEQGRIDDATKLFQVLTQTKIKADNSLIELYQSKAQEYLKDAELLRENQPWPLPTTPELCRKKAQTYDALIEGLNTYGRAKFNIRVWQVQLERHAKRLEETPSLANASRTIKWAEIFPEILKLCSNYRYLDATELAKNSKPTGETEEKKRSAYLNLCEAADMFLADLEKDLNKTPINLSLKSKDGRNFSRVIGAGESMVTLMQLESEASLPWTQLNPNDVIAMYREVIRRGSAEGNVNQRHERAICFQWLSGEKDAAQAAAAKLGESSPTFKKRWSDWMSSVQ